jgi:D-tyrosyl-tRNA(Tyr) deacylase
VRVVVQRVSSATVEVDGRVLGQIGEGMVVLVAARHGDGTADADWLAEKLAHLRVFGDETGKMNRSLLETGGEALVISQFTLYGDARKGRRPSFVESAPPDLAAPLIDRVTAGLVARGVRTATGSFGAHMVVTLRNDGPVTIILESPGTDRAESARMGGRSA